MTFSHPSGFFTQGDSSQLHLILRNARTSPKKPPKKSPPSAPKILESNSLPQLRALVQPYYHQDSNPFGWPYQLPAPLNSPGESGSHSSESDHLSAHGSDYGRSYVGKSYATYLASDQHAQLPPLPTSFDHTLSPQEDELSPTPLPLFAPIAPHLRIASQAEDFHHGTTLNRFSVHSFESSSSIPNTNSYDLLPSHHSYYSPAPSQYHSLSPPSSFASPYSPTSDAEDYFEAEEGEAIDFGEGTSQYSASQPSPGRQSRAKPWNIKRRSK